MYDFGPSEEELEAIGIKREDVEDTSISEVWPENWLTFQLFRAMSTQWRMGSVGAVGLDYNVAFQLMTLHGVKPQKQLEVMQSLRIMESAALTQMSKS